MTGRDSLDPVQLRQLETVPSFHVEGYLYETADGARQFYVFTAGDGTVWSATEPDADRRAVGRYLVRVAPDHQTCVRLLAQALANE
jgi:hypothetical protein